MKTSPAGIDFIRSREGLRLVAYPDPGSANGLPVTNGYGSTRRLDGGPWTVGERITETEAVALLSRDLSDAEAAVNRLVKVPLTQSQFDALVSFVFNVGAGAFERSTLLRVLNSGDYAGAAAQFGRWIYNDGKVMQGLSARRAAERAMFEQPAPIEESQPTIVRAPEPAPEPEAAREVDHAELVSSVWKALQAGYKLARSTTWKRRQIAVNAVAALLAGAVGIAKALGYDMAVDDETLLAVGGVVWAVVSLFDAGATAATTASVGLPARSPGRADDGAGSREPAGL